MIESYLWPHFQGRIWILTPAMFPLFTWQTFLSFLNSTLFAILIVTSVAFIVNAFILIKIVQGIWEISFLEWDVTNAFTFSFSQYVFMIIFIDGRIWFILYPQVEGVIIIICLIDFFLNWLTLLNFLLEARVSDIRIIQTLYWEKTAYIRIENEFGKYTYKENDVRQGCVFSLDSVNLFVRWFWEK